MLDMYTQESAQVSIWACKVVSRYTRGLAGRAVILCALEVGFSLAITVGFFRTHAEGGLSRWRAEAGVANFSMGPSSCACHRSLICSCLPFVKLHFPVSADRIAVKGTRTDQVGKGERDILANWQPYQRQLKGSHIPSFVYMCWGKGTDNLEYILLGYSKLNQFSVL